MHPFIVYDKDMRTGQAGKEGWFFDAGKMRGMEALGGSSSWMTLSANRR